MSTPIYRQGSLGITPPYIAGSTATAYGRETRSELLKSRWFTLYADHLCLSTLVSGSLCDMSCDQSTESFKGCQPPPVALLAMGGAPLVRTRRDTRLLPWCVLLHRSDRLSIPVSFAVQAFRYRWCILDHMPGYLSNHGGSPHGHRRTAHAHENPVGYTNRNGMSTPHGMGGIER